MIVVSDTGPINYLVQLGIIEILPQLFDTVACLKQSRLSADNTAKAKGLARCE